MKKVDIDYASKNLDSLIQECLRGDDKIMISCTSGNVVMVKEEDYRNAKESLHLIGTQGIYQDIEEISLTPTKALNKKSPF